METIVDVSSGGVRVGLAVRELQHADDALSGDQRHHQGDRSRRTRSMSATSAGERSGSSRLVMTTGSRVSTALAHRGPVVEREPPALPVAVDLPASTLVTLSSVAPSGACRCRTSARAATAQSRFAVETRTSSRSSDEESSKLTSLDQGHALGAAVELVEQRRVGQRAGGDLGEAVEQVGALEAAGVVVVDAGDADHLPAADERQAQHGAVAPAEVLRLARTR